jgi:5-methyltetrahydrofolate--homocysteine methyltransferase
LNGKYPAILSDPKVGTEASKLFADAQRLLDEIVDKKLLTANAVYGFFRAHADGDDIVVDTEKRLAEGTVRLHTLRQQWEREGQTCFRSLADYIAPPSAGIVDHVGAFAVTTGHGADELVRRFEADHDDYNAIMTKALADRLAEAFAEWLHLQARRDWGYGAEENLTKDELIHEKYRGIRPAPGYPAQPDHTEKATLWKLLDAETETGIRLTESYAMWPAASVSGLYFSHPEVRYFAVDAITREQVQDYAERKGIPVAEAERWLAPNLGYDVQ